MVSERIMLRGRDLARPRRKAGAKDRHGQPGPTRPGPLRLNVMGAPARCRGSAERHFEGGRQRRRIAPSMCVEKVGEGSLYLAEIGRPDFSGEP